MKINERKRLGQEHKHIIQARMLESTGEKKWINIDDLLSDESVNIRRLDNHYINDLARRTQDSNISNKPALVVWHSNYEKYCIVDGQHVTEKQRKNGETEILCEILKGDAADWKTKILALNTSGIFNNTKKVTTADIINDLAKKKIVFYEYINKGAFIEWYFENCNSHEKGIHTIKKYSGWIDKLSQIDSRDKYERTFLQQCVYYDLEFTIIQELVAQGRKEKMEAKMSEIRDNPKYNRDLKEYIKESDIFKEKISIKKVDKEVVKDSATQRRINDHYRSIYPLLSDVIKNDIMNEDQISDIFDEAEDLIIDKLEKMEKMIAVIKNHPKDEPILKAKKVKNRQDKPRMFIITKEHNKENLDDKKDE